jgi:hypothetical protein
MALIIHRRKQAGLVRQQEQEAEREGGVLPVPHSHWDLGFACWYETRIEREFWSLQIVIEGLPTPINAIVHRVSNTVSC